MKANEWVERWQNAQEDAARRIKLMQEGYEQAAQLLSEIATVQPGLFVRREYSQLCLVSTKATRGILTLIELSGTIERSACDVTWSIDSINRDREQIYTSHGDNAENWLSPLDAAIRLHAVFMIQHLTATTLEQEYFLEFPPPP